MSRVPRDVVPMPGWSRCRGDPGAGVIPMPSCSPCPPAAASPGSQASRNRAERQAGAGCVTGSRRGRGAARGVPGRVRGVSRGSWWSRARRHTWGSRGCDKGPEPSGVRRCRGFCAVRPRSRRAAHMPGIRRRPADRSGARFWPYLHGSPVPGPVTPVARVASAVSSVGSSRRAAHGSGRARGRSWFRPGARTPVRRSCRCGAPGCRGRRASGFRPRRPQVWRRWRW